VGALALLRLSGPQAIALVSQVFVPPGRRAKPLDQQPSHTLHFGTLQTDNQLLDEVVVSLYRAPRSFTKEDVAEITCHGSPYIVRQVLQLFVQRGARLAQPGEFTQRAFLHGAMDLAQAEAVADLIAADSQAAHQAAFRQLRGGFSKQIGQLREQLVHFAAMVELELDFGEEDVEFADRAALRQLVNELQAVVNPLVQSFSLGNAIKNGVPVVIAGKPNAGKSTLLNALLNEEKAIVSDIPGTTRDFIEDQLVIDGLVFRFIDTAGLRHAQDQIEAMGVARTRAKMEEASLVIYLFDLQDIDLEDLRHETAQLTQRGTPWLLVGNKLDRLPGRQLAPEWQTSLNELAQGPWLQIAAQTSQGIEALKQRLLAAVQTQNLAPGDPVVTNLRHYEALQNTAEALARVRHGLDTRLTGDFLAMDIRQALYHLGTITGQVSSDDLLGHIFSRFCIGK
jgi:tRNA modification GTPase